MTPRLLRYAWCVAAFAGAGVTAGAQAGPLPARLADARRASAAGDHATALRIVDSLAAAHPHHPNVVFARAVALGAAGRAAEAESVVRQLLRWDPRYARSALRDSALAALRARLGTDVGRLADRADWPVARARVLTVLEERDLVPEGTAWDPVTRSVLVGSLNKNKVIAIATDGSVSDRVPPGASGLGSVVGIHVDTLRRVLWVASNARYDRTTDTTRSALYAFDAPTGTFKARYPASDPGPHFLNDLTTTPDGTVYVTDTRAGAVWRLRPGGTALERLDAVDVTSPNGITVSANGQHLFVADLDRIWVIALPNGPAWRLTVPDSFNTAFIDGLAFRDDALIAHHPLSFWRIVRYRLDREHRAITGREIIEWNTPHSRTSTTGEVVDDRYVFIGNSQIDRMNAGTLDSATMDPISIYSVPLALPTTGRVAVALSGRDSVAIFDAQTLERSTALPVGKNPHEISVSPDGARAFVANARGRSISVISGGATPRVTGTWSLPDSVSVHDVVSAGDGRTVWAVSGERKLLLEVDAQGGSVRRRIPLTRPGSWMVAAGARVSSIIVANLEGGAVTLVDPSTGRERVLEGREGEIDAIPTPDGREIW
ncbi:MAG TPA: tetratricopeptide repeat protein, partial [Gemmatimonadaceae bacterium]|nr:tetratricopeptide repeat protein [Gemmatimonadaceae bacterium]